MKSPYYYLLALIFLVACQNKTPKANEPKITSKVVQASHFFSGTKKFCDGLNMSYYFVSINKDNIVIKCYVENETKPYETIIGKIKDDKIITQDSPLYPLNRFKYENGNFYEFNNEGDYNENKECEVENSLKSNKAKIDFKSNDGSSYFKTRLTDGYYSGEVNFANYYIAITWGCGTSCIDGKMIDVRDGKIYDLPLGEDVTFSMYDSDQEKISFTANSNIITVISGREIIRDEITDDVLSYDQWNYNIALDENRKEFITTTKIKKIILK